MTMLSMKTVCDTIQAKPEVSVTFKGQDNIAMINVLASAAISMRVQAYKLKMLGEDKGSEAGMNLANGAYSFLGEVMEAYGFTPQQTADMMNSLTVSAFAGEETTEDEEDEIVIEDKAIEEILRKMKGTPKH